MNRTADVGLSVSLRFLLTLGTLLCPPPSRRNQGRSFSMPLMRQAVPSHALPRNEDSPTFFTFLNLSRSLNEFWLDIPPSPENDLGCNM